MNKYLNDDSGRLSISSEGYAFLDKAITDTKGDVYAFTGIGLSPVTAAAAMARLSRSTHDMRVTILKEFAEIGKDEQLLRRVITMYGDDSVQQLVGTHIAVEGASNLLTKYIEWGRLASYLEQSTRYIFYDEKDNKGKYKYFVPKTFSAETLSIYTQAMDEIFTRYSEIVHAIYDHIATKSETPDNERDGAWKSAVRAQACDAARALLPVATKSTVGIYGSSQAIENMIMRLRAHPNQEAQDCGEAMLKQVRKVAPTFFERADKPERGGGTSAYLGQTRENLQVLVDKMKVFTSSQNDQVASVELAAYSPSDDMDIVKDIVYEASNMSLGEISTTIDELSDRQQQSLFDAYFGKRLNRRHRPGRALENINYTFDIVCDYGIFRDLQRHRLVNDLRWQQLTPTLGYEVPELVTEAGQEKKFRSVFDISKKLHTTLIDSEDLETAQYAVLLGHNMRWRISFNAREAFHLLELRTAPQGHPGYRKLCKLMYDKINDVHPNVAKHMVFINKDEDPQLTRLAAERASQRKLKALDT